MRKTLRLTTAVTGVCLLVLSGCEVQPDPPVAGSPSTSRSTETTATTATTRTKLACTIPDRFRAKELSTLPASDNVIALTFDGGSNAAGVRSILDTLASRRGSPTNIWSETTPTPTPT
jgi:hypothetical protein